MVLLCEVLLKQDGFDFPRPSAMTQNILLLERDTAFVDARLLNFRDEAAKHPSVE